MLKTYCPVQDFSVGTAQAVESVSIPTLPPDGERCRHELTGWSKIDEGSIGGQDGTSRIPDGVDGPGFARRWIRLSHILLRSF